MFNKRAVLLAISSICLGAVSLKADPITVTGTGADAAALLPTVNNYRTLLGTLNPNQVGSLGTGRREVNWDGVPLQFQTPNNMPPDFFNVNSPRGNVYTTPGTGFLISNNNNPATPEDEGRFGNVNPQYATEFVAFSNPRLFAVAGSTQMDVLFFVPGTNTPAQVLGFGAVFEDVDAAGATSIDYFRNGVQIFSLAIQAADKGLSFGGALFDTPFDSVRIHLGTGLFGANDGPGSDVVVMDDFIYSEPNAAVSGVPEPGTNALLGAGLVALAMRVRQRKASTR